MTRQQVAKRLGKSLATVRRLEGVRLNPIRDARGVYQFDPDEVEALAEAVGDGTVALWQELGGDGGLDAPRGCPNCRALEGELARMRTEFDARSRMRDRLLAEAKADYERQAAALVAQVEELLAGLDE